MQPSQGSAPATRTIVGRKVAALQRSCALRSRIPGLALLKRCAVLYFDIDSAQSAFDALAPLALGSTREELLWEEQRSQGSEAWES
jgi:hypothetical protein